MSRLQEYLPSYYLDSKQMSTLLMAQEIELDNIAAGVLRQRNDMFIMTASSTAVRRREKMLRIQADPATESLDFRRRRIINRQSTKPPFTHRWLQSQLDRLLGPGLAVVSVNPAEFLLLVTTNIENANLFREVQHTIQTVKPANMVYQQNTSLRHRIGVKHTTTKRDVSWNYKLDGSWKLGEKPFATLGPEVML
ncbi:phage portal protein [Paenibacillus xylanexedens]|uniref:putative phage tail protein n=1 Tax=Paenibacillus xylanexedens TaxID=528191 RepID=UPI0009380C86|nr:putative phage tail protein [Paenibacillus xylanexedens]APO43350.1 phage portal protein [Paenibacillus xylanexedens]